MNQQTPTKPQIYVLFHANCSDGTGAKYSAWKKFGSNANYIPVQYNQPVPEMIKGSEIYILDFSYNRATMEDLVKDHAKVVVLDHHKTAEEELRAFPGAIFNMNKSGAILAWEYFHPDTDIPELLLDVQDRDLWKFKRKNTDNSTAALPLLKNSMENWDDVCSNIPKYRSFVSSGKVLTMVKEMKVEKTVRDNVVLCRWGEYNIGITNSTEYGSEIGNAICKTYGNQIDFAVVYFILPNADVMFSLRSEASTNNFDVSAVAKANGGGGHRNAAGCKLTLQQLARILHTPYGTHSTNSSSPTVSA